MNDLQHDDIAAEQAQEELGTKPKRGPLRRILRWAAWSTLGLVGATTAAIGGGMYFLSTESGGRWVTSAVNSALTGLPSGMSAGIESFDASLPFHAAVRGFQLKDAEGECISLELCSLTIDWTALPKAFVISEIRFDSPRLVRLPHADASPEAEPASEPAADPFAMLDKLGAFLQEWPSWLPEFRLDRLAVQHLRIEEQAFGLPFAASATASASAGASGIGLSFDALREDIPADGADARLAMTAALSPQLDLSLDLKGSDMGFAAMLLPPELATPSFSMALQGRGTLEDWKGRLDSSFRLEKTDAAVLRADVGLGLKDDTFSVRSALSLRSGKAVSALWRLAGQNGGAFEAGIKADAKIGTSMNASAMDAKASANLKLSDMAWAEPLLTAVIGKEASFSAGASAFSGENGTMSLTLDSLKLRAAQVQASAEGSASLASAGIFDPASKVDLRANASLADVAAAASGFSGDAAVSADIKGTLSALQAKLDLSSRKLHLPEARIDGLRAELELPSADIPRLMADIPRVLDTTLRRGASASQARDEASLLAGRAKASLQMNGQPLRIVSDWSVAETASPSSGLRFSLSELDANASDSSVRGRLTAHMPYAPSTPAGGSVAAMAGMPLPLIDGRLSIDVADWKPLGELAGLTLSGEPLSARLELDADAVQHLRWDCALPSFQLAGASPLSLSNFRSAAKASDLWGRPQAEIHVSASEVRIPEAALSDISAQIDGGLDKLNVRAASHGDVLADIEGRWAPGNIHLEKLSAQIVPALAGLAGDSPLGLSMDGPADIHYSQDSFKLDPTAISFLPAGRMTASGAWSPERFDVAANLESVDLKPFQQFVPDIPAGRLSMDARFNGTPQKPSGELLLSLEQMQAVGSSIPPVDCDIRGALAVHGKKRMFEASVDIPEHSRNALGLQQAEVKAAIPFTAPEKGMAMPDMKGSLDASVRLKGDLGQIWRLVPSADQRLAGQADIDIKVGGKVAEPVLTARADVKEGRFLDIAQGVELTDIQLHADVEKLDIMKMSGGRARLSLSASDGRSGTLGLQGWFDPKDMSLDIGGALKDLSPLHRPDVGIVLSGDLGVEGTVSSPRIFADITVDKGQVMLTKLPGGAITTLDIDEGDSAQPEGRPSVPGSLDVRVRIPNQFFLRGYGLDCEWQGGLNVQGALDRPEVTGELQAVRGTLDILGKNFKLAEGRIDFNGGWPVSPLLNIDMEYVTGAVTANIRVGGTASDPKLTLSSQPELPQDEVLSQIMFGQSSGSLSHVQALQLASGAATLAGFGGGDIMGLGRKMLGVDVFKLNSDNDGDDSDVSRTSLEMGTYVLDNVYVGVEQGIGKESETGAVVEIELLPSLEAQAKASGSKTEIGLEWKKNY